MVIFHFHAEATVANFSHLNMVRANIYLAYFVANKDSLLMDFQRIKHAKSSNKVMVTNTMLNKRGKKKK